MTNPTPVTTGVKRYKGEWKYAQVAHLLRRTMFGAKMEDVDHFLRQSPKRAVRELLKPDYPCRRRPSTITMTINMWTPRYQPARTGRSRSPTMA